MALTLVMALMAGVRQAKFAPKFTVELSDTKALGNPAMTFHLEFAEDDEEIGLFTGFLPKGFTIAGDEDDPRTTNEAGQEVGEVIGSGEIAIAAGPTCHPGPEGGIPSKQTSRSLRRSTSAVAPTKRSTSGVHAVWLLDLEPAQPCASPGQGSPPPGGRSAVHPDPSDNTCNPLIVDLTINATSESGVKIITNPKKPGKKKFMADISSQDSPTIAHFEQIITITK